MISQMGRCSYVENSLCSKNCFGRIVAWFVDRSTCSGSEQTESIEVLKESAKSGDAPTQFSLGWMYYEGIGVKQSYAEAAKWYRKAADQGDAGAQYNLGVMYYEGKGVRQNYRMAKEYFGKSCDNGYDPGCEEYAKMNKAGY